MTVFFFFSVSALNISYHYFLAYKVSDKKNLLRFLLRILCMWWVASLLTLSSFSLYLWLPLNSLIIMCLSVGFFEFILEYRASWMFIFMYFLKFGKFWQLFLQIIFLFGDSQCAYSWSWWCSPRFLRLASLFYLFSFCCIGLTISITLYSGSLILYSSYLNVLLNPCN